jgi:hypothetical protein
LLIARRIGMVEVGLFAHRDYVAAFGLPNRAEDIAGHRRICFDRDAHDCNPSVTEHAHDFR